FMQFDRDSTGTYNPLPKPSVDTGMGLERVSAVLQGVLSNYETELFTPLSQIAVNLISTQTSARKIVESTQTSMATSLNVIADHSRAATFLISDGVLPGNEGRAYVLRKILRRAIRHGRLNGASEPFLFKMVHAVSDLMSDAYPELQESKDIVSKTVEAEEIRFHRTLDLGLERLEEDFDNAVKSALQRSELISVEDDSLTKWQKNKIQRSLAIQELGDKQIVISYPGEKAF